MKPMIMLRRRRRVPFTLAAVAAAFSFVLLPTEGWILSTRPTTHQRDQTSLCSSLLSKTTESSVVPPRKTRFMVEAPSKASLTTPITQSSPPKASVHSEALKRLTELKAPKTQTKRPKSDAYQWLTWFHNQFAEVGTVDAAILKKVLAAMDGYAQARNLRAAEHAEALLSCYIDEVERACVAVTANSPNDVAPENGTLSSLTLNVTVFNAAMNAFAQIGDPAGTQRILGRLKNLQTTTHPYLQPDAFTFTTLVNAWVKSKRPQAASKAEAILTHVEQHCSFPPTTHLYNVVLAAWADGDLHNDTVYRAEALVARMSSLGSAPDLYTYQTLISLYSKSRLPNAPAKAEGILRWLEQSDILHPNVHCYTAVMRAYAYSRTCPGKAEKAYALLQELQRRHEVLGQQSCRPNVVAFTSVLNACIQPVYESERQRSFQLCKTVFGALCDSPHYGRPNYLTYATYLQTIASTLDPGFVRDNETRRIFLQCCAAGQVGDIVLSKLRRAASHELWCELLESVIEGNESRGVDYERLPLAWTINVRGERRGETRQHSL